MKQTPQLGKNYAHGSCQRTFLKLLSLILAIVMTTSSALAQKTTETCAGFKPPDIISKDGEPTAGSLPAARLAHLRAEAKLLFPKSTAGCPVAIQLANAPAGETAAFGSEGYRVLRNDGQFILEAATSLGHLRGVYSIFRALGVLFISAHDTIQVPLKLAAQLPEGKIVRPIVAMRGLWAFGDNRDPAFLLWAGRKGFNLLGGDFGEKHQHLFKLLGIYQWGGGHNVLSSLAPTDRPIAGRKLAETNPEWFGIGTGFSVLWDWLTRRRNRNPVPYGADSYSNPCFGNPEYVRFVASRLVEELIRGRYRKLDIINIWPSDSPALTVSRHCAHAPGSSNAKDDYIYFTNRLSKLLAESPLLRKSGRKIILAGIG